MTTRHATTAQIAKAQQMLNDIRTGKTVFTKAADRWLIAGPADAIQAYRTVTVTKTDGTTKKVIVDTVQSTGEKQGVRYAIASFRDQSKAAPRDTTPRTVRSDAFGRGVQYGDGATVYTGVNGGRTQIWDD